MTGTTDEMTDRTDNESSHSHPGSHDSERDYIVVGGADGHTPATSSRAGAWNPTYTPPSINGSSYDTAGGGDDVYTPVSATSREEVPRMAAAFSQPRSHVATPQRDSPAQDEVPRIAAAYDRPRDTQDVRDDDGPEQDRIARIKAMFSKK